MAAELWTSADLNGYTDHYAVLDLKALDVWSVGYALHVRISAWWQNVTDFVLRST